MNAPEAMQVIDMTNLYWAIGALVVTNIGTVGTIIIGMGRALWWVSKLDSRVDTNTKDIHAAFKKIREIQE